MEWRKPMAERTCRKCDGMGMVIVERADGRHLAEPCECRVTRRLALLHRRSRIPERYAGCTLEDFETNYPGGSESIRKAFIVARKFADHYPHGVEGTGLLFTGTVGTGKTHLAVAILQALVLQKGVKALFCDHRQLLKSIHNSYNPNVPVTELEVLQPVFDAEVLVLDELGSAKKTEWVFDIVEHILNTRYNDRKTTIITTNYPYRPAGGDRIMIAKQEEPTVTAEPALPAAEDPYRVSEPSSMDQLLKRLDQIGSVPAIQGTPAKMTEPRRMPLSGVKGAIEEPRTIVVADKPKGMREETLGERIGERMRSRLAEMCVVVEMTGADYRQGARRARFR